MQFSNFNLYVNTQAGTEFLYGKICKPLSNNQQIIGQFDNLSSNTISLMPGWLSKEYKKNVVYCHYISSI